MKFLSGYLTGICTIFILSVAFQYYYPTVPRVKVYWYIDNSYAVEDKLGGYYVKRIYNNPKIKWELSSDRIHFLDSTFYYTKDSAEIIEKEYIKHIHENE